MNDDFNRSNIDHYLYLVAKEYKKNNRQNPESELILVGGASIILNYNFRNATTDLDSIIKASSSMKDIIKKVGDEQGLNIDWLNDDFKRTISYSVKLSEHSHFYKKFCNCLNVRTVTGEYLLAMKIRSARKYKHDMSDIIGIIKEHRERQKELDIDKVNLAYNELYGENINQTEMEELKKIFQTNDLEAMFYETVENESLNKKAVLRAEELYPDTVNEKNIDDFINHFKSTTDIFTDPSDNDLKDFLDIADTDETDETEPQKIAFDNTKDSEQPSKNNIEDEEIEL